jgi:hypothetical protein
MSDWDVLFKKKTEPEQTVEPAAVEEQPASKPPETSEPQQPQAPSTVVQQVQVTEKLPVTQDLESKEVFVIYGHKGHGKTYLAFTFPGTIACLSFDRKSTPVWKKRFNGDSRIKVYDAMIYEDFSTQELTLSTSELTFKHINEILTMLSTPENRPDWVLIDGSEILQQIAEMLMRYRNNIMPFQGIANRNLWKERRLYIRQVHNKSLSAAKRGVIYTTYIDKDEIIVDGEVRARTDVPKWIDAILYETDTVIKVTSKSDGSGHHFWAEVESSKGSLKTGEVKEVTGIGMSAFKELV